MGHAATFLAYETSKILLQLSSKESIGVELSNVGRMLLGHFPRLEEFATVKVMSLRKRPDGTGRRYVTGPNIPIAA